MNSSALQHAVAERSAEIYKSVGPRIDKVRTIFTEFTCRQKILDVGCATGEILGPFAQTHEIHGVDISESLLALAVKAGLKVTKTDLETEPLPYLDKTFDVVFCGETIEHHVNTDWMVSEMNRVLRPGGLLILTFPNIRTLVSIGMMLFFDLPPMYSARYRAPHYRDFTLRTIKIVLGNHGFAFEKAVGSAFFLPKVGEFGLGLANLFPSWAQTVIVSATKAKDSVYSPEETIGELNY